MLGSPKRDPIRFGFLKTQEPRVKFWVGFGPDPALGVTDVTDATEENNNLIM